MGKEKGRLKTLSSPAAQIKMPRLDAYLSRADSAASQHREFFIYVDEFQSFTTLSVANMISELRKFGIGLVLAHQHLDQLEPAVQHAVIGNAGSLITFRLGSLDAQIMEREFAPVFQRQDLVSLPNFDIYVKLMIDGEPSRPFSATTLLH